MPDNDRVTEGLSEPEPAIGWEIIRLAMPVLAEQCLQFFVGLWDYYLSGHLTGPGAAEATEAVGTTVYGSWLASLIFTLVSAGTTALISRAWGAGDSRHAARIGTVSLGLGMVAGIVYGTVAWTGAPYLAAFLKLSPTATALAVEYLRWDAIAAVPFSVTIVGAAALRGTGNMRTPLLIFSVVSAVNVLMAWSFVDGFGPIPALGASGIIFGTFTAKWIGGTLMALCFALGLGGLRLTAVSRGEALSLVRRMLRIGLPAAVDGISLWCAQIFFLRIIHQAGDTALKAHFVGIEMESLSYLPAMAWGIATATLIGHRLGAGFPERAIQVARAALQQVIFVGALAGLTFYFGAERIFGLMHQDEAVRRVGADALRLLAAFEPLLVIGIVSVYALRGAGETRLPMLLTVFSTVFVRLPFAYWAVGAGWGLRGAWMGMCADITLRGIASSLLLLRGRWARIRV